MANPDYRVYTVIKHLDEKGQKTREDFWIDIGAAFRHSKGDGYTITLQALPLQDPDGKCRLVLRKYVEKPDQAPPPEDHDPAPPPRSGGYRDTSRGR